MAEEMKAGISYNVFNGEEFLLPSLRQVRPHVEYINAVVQYVSNTGRPCSARLRAILAEGLSSGLLNEIHEFEPNLAIAPRLNELAKRNIGLELAKARGVTHFMTMDCDEFYLPAQFAKARARIEREGIKASAVMSYLHIKRPVWRSADPDTTHCVFLTAIDTDSRHTLNAPYPVLVDPKRRLHGLEASFVLFPPNEIAMYHMNLVRHDLGSKLANSVNAGNTEFMARVVRAYESWRPGQQLHFPNKPPMAIVEVDDIFGLEMEGPRNGA